MPAFSLFKGSRQKRKYEQQAQQLVKLGFTDKDKSIQLLKEYAGDVNLVLEEYYDLYGHEADKYKEEGNRLMKEDKYYSAVQAYTKSIQMNPRNAIYYGNRAAAYTKLEMYKEALIDSNISQKIDPDYIKSYIRAGAAYFGMQQYQKSYDSYFKALKKLDMKDVNNYAYCLKKMKLCQMKMSRHSKSKSKSKAKSKSKSNCTSHSNFNNRQNGISQTPSK